MLAEIQANVKRLFQQDKPLHHLDSARALEYDPKGSVFYVTTTQEFDKLDADQIQEIFRRRHILIPGTPEQDVRFDRIGLATLGSFKATREIQGKVFLPNNPTISPVLTKCSQFPPQSRVPIRYDTKGYTGRFARR